MKSTRTVFASVLLALSLAFSGAVAQAAAMSDYLENKLIDHVFRGTSFTAPANIYVALYTSSCSDTGGGTEVTGGSYARVAVATGTTTWTNTQASGTGASSGTGGTTSNSSAVNFATPSAGWGTVTYVGLTDASTSGNLLVCSALTTGKTINTSDTVSFPTGTLTFQIDN